MKILKLSLFFLAIFLPLISEGAEKIDLSIVTATENRAAKELSALDHMIEATEQTLKNQIKLRELIKQYQELQKNYLLHPDDNETLYKMIKTAHIILENIKEYHLTQVMDQEFLSELTIISKPAAKLGVPRP